MLSLTRGLLGGLLVLGLLALGSTPNDLAAQAKKDDKKKTDPVAKKAPPKKDDTGDRSVSFATSDGLALNGYWFQGTGIEKQRPDAVMMFPAPGSKVTDAWIDLARSLSEKNFSVLLFDWRGCGRNGPETGARVFESPDQFWADPYNNRLLKGMRATIDDKGLDYSKIIGRSDAQLRYRDFLMNDLQGARFFLDKQSDNGRCNTNRVWIVSEKEGVHLGLGFIAAEFRRNSIYNPKVEPFATVQVKSAGKDYVGVLALSYSANSPTGTAAFRAALPDDNSLISKEARSHFEGRLATVLVYSKKEGASASRGLISRLNGGSTEETMKRNFKYLREVDVGGKTITGIGMIDPMDSFKTKELIQTAMVEISKVQNIGKDATDREANKMTVVPRFPMEAVFRLGR